MSEEMQNNTSDNSAIEVPTSSENESRSVKSEAKENYRDMYMHPLSVLLQLNTGTPHYLIK
jgi:hypothetical protein